MNQQRTVLCREAKSLANELLGGNSVSKVTILPPDVDENTDTDDIDDELTGAPIPSGDIAGQYEIEFTEENLGLSDVEPPSKKRKLQHNWIESDNDLTDSGLLPLKIPFNEKSILEKLEEKLESITDPVGLFELFFDDGLLDIIVEQSLNYALQKNFHDFRIDKADMKVFIGFLLFTGYHNLPREKLYWSLREDFGIPLIRQAFSRDRFWEIKRFLHVVDNNLAKETVRKDFKISTLYDYLNEKFKQFGILDENIAIDEQMVKYYGHSSLKQFIKSKPIRFGMKNWVAAGKSGYCYHVKLYCGKESYQSSNEPLGTRVVLELIRKCNIDSTNCLFADNFFMSCDLLSQLRELQIPAIGTVRANRTGNCPLKNDKDLQRGSMDSKVDTDNKISLTKWQDNRSVIVGTNFQTDCTNQTVKRWKKLKAGAAKIEIPIPSIIKSYNNGMGGVDQLDCFVNCYRISISSKKWYWCLITNMIDICVSNAWNLHRKLDRKCMDLLEFRSEIALTYLKLSVGRSSSISCKTIPRTIDSIRFDGHGHSLETREKQRRCQGENCKSKPKTFCMKCNITLCKFCFGPYHNRY